MSPNDDDPKERNKKKYLWFGYGGYANFGEFGPTNPGNIRADPGIFDKAVRTIWGERKAEKRIRERQEIDKNRAKESPFARFFILFPIVRTRFRTSQSGNDRKSCCKRRTQNQSKSDNHRSGEIPGIGQIPMAQ